MTREPLPPETVAAYAAADWCIHHVVPLFLERVGMLDQAAFIRGLPVVKDRARALQADAAIIGIIDRHNIMAFPHRTVLGTAAVAALNATYSPNDVEPTVALCAEAALELGVDDDQTRFVAHGGAADLVRSIWTLLELD